MRGTESRKRKRVVATEGIAHINATFNNTIVTITDKAGNTLSWSSAGKMGFKGARQGTPHAAQLVGDDAADKAKQQGLRTVEIRVRGAGAGRESAMRAVKAAGLNVRSIKDVTGIPFNGCRPPKKRRV